MTFGMCNKIHLHNVHTEMCVCERERSSKLRKIRNFDGNVNFDWDFVTDRKLNGFHIDLMLRVFVCVRECVNVNVSVCLMDETKNVR